MPKIFLSSIQTVWSKKIIGLRCLVKWASDVYILLTPQIKKVQNQMMCFEKERWIPYHKLLWVEQERKKYRCKNLQGVHYSVIYFVYCKSFL